MLPIKLQTEVRRCLSHSWAGSYSDAVDKKAGERSLNADRDQEGQVMGGWVSVHNQSLIIVYLLMCVCMRACTYICMIC